MVRYSGYHFPPQCPLLIIDFAFPCTTLSRTVINLVLLAAETTNTIVQSAIQLTQWHKEVSIWFAISLARLQASVVEWAVGPKYLVPGSGIQVKSTLLFIEKIMCRNQLVRNTGPYQSFSVLGVALILAIGTC